LRPSKSWIAKRRKQTIFGITTLDTPASWYPVAAVPVLLLTVGVALGINRAMTYLESRNLQRNTLTRLVPRLTGPLAAPQSKVTSSAPIQTVIAPEIRAQRPPSNENVRPHDPASSSVPIQSAITPEIGVQRPSSNENTHLHDPAPRSPSIQTAITPEIRVQTPPSNENVHLHDPTSIRMALLPTQTASTPSLLRPEVRVQRLHSNEHVGLREEFSQISWPVDLGRSSSAALSYRVSGVARVDSGQLGAGDMADASPGALRSPSGTLRRYG
jgi:hypothetical protein